MTENITMIELFSGIGAQERALRQLHIPYQVTHTCDCDKDAVLSYAAMRTDFENEFNSYNFPSVEDMISELQDKNVGFDFMKNKHTITTRTPINKLKQYYLADKLSHNLGDIGKVEKLPYADMVTYSFPCFIPGTMVLTEEGYKNIEDIQEGDVVLTHTNQYQRVVKPMQNYCDSYVYKIDTMCSDPIYTTEEHPFYVRKKSRIWNNTKRMYDRKFAKPEWVKAKDLTKDYYVGVAINQKSETPQWYGITLHWSDGRKDRYSNKIIECINKEDFWWTIGRYLGDGWLRTDGGIIICCASNETVEITTVLDRLEWNYNIVNEKTVDKIHIPFKEIGVFCSQFGRGAENKRLTSSVLNLPVSLLKAFLDGYISADGSFTQNKYKVSSVSKELIYGIGQCVAKVYCVPFSVYKTKRKPTCIIEGRTVNQRCSYSLVFKIDKCKQDKAFYEDGYIWCPINNISTENYVGYVYNMEVENDNSYVVQNIIVHNCTDLSVAGKGEGMQNKCDSCGHSWPIDFSNAEEMLICPNCGGKVSSSTRSGLLGQVQRLLSVAYENNELPKYLLLENVKNLVGKKFKAQFDAWVKWLDGIGYNTYYQVLNAKHYGIPQNRERIFAISIRKDIDNGKFKFPDKIPLNIRLKDILEKNVDEKYYLPDDRIDKILNTYFSKNSDPFIVASRGRNPENPSDRTTGAPTEQRLEPNYNGTTNCLTSVQKDNYVCEPQMVIGSMQANSYIGDGSISPSLTAAMGMGGGQIPMVGYVAKDPIVCEERRDEGIRLFNDDCVGTLRTIDACGDKRVLEPTEEIRWRIRKLTPKCCWRLMGFTDFDYDSVAKYVSASSLYKQAGNSICTCCLIAIFNALFLEDYSTSYNEKLVDYNS